MNRSADVVSLKRLAVALITMSLASPVFGQAQASQATLSAVVTDATGAVVPGAELTLLDSNRGARRSFLPPTVTTHSPSFRLEPQC
jgi:hypothetical protein